MKVELLSGAAIAILLAAPVPRAIAASLCRDQNAEALKVAEAAERTCVLRAAVDFEPSGENAEIVAKGALGQCEHEFGLAFDAATRCYPANMLESYDDVRHIRVGRVAIARVLEIRSKRTAGASR